MKHIGMDVHSTTSDVCVLNQRGIEILHRQVKSTEQELVGLISSIRGDKRVTVEESQMADWVARVLKPHVTEIIRCEPRHNRLISQSEIKNDQEDARRLAQLLYLNQLKPVHHPDWIFHQLREGVRAYWRSSWDLTRAKSRVKAFFLFNGMHQTGERVYSLRSREKLLDEVGKKNANLQLIQYLWMQLDQAKKMKMLHLRMLGSLVQPVQDPARRVQTIPGIGRIGAATLVAYLERGLRFDNKRQLWQYAGLGRREHKSRGKGTEGASKRGNRYVKNVAMTAASTISTGTRETALWRLWQRGLEQGTDPRRVRRNVARKVLVIAQALLRSGGKYDDARVIVSR